MNQEDQGELPSGPKDLSELAKLCQEVMDGPNDLPRAKLAFEGLALCIEAVTERIGGATCLAKQIAKSFDKVHAGVAENATVLALSRRKGKHLLYWLAIEIGKAAEGEQKFDKPVLELVGHQFLLRFLKSTKPSPLIVAKCHAALCRPDSKAAKKWSSKARARSLHAATLAVAKAISENPQGAAAVGLIGPRTGAQCPQDPITIFNGGHRTRIRYLREFARLPAKAGAGGHGTLPADALRAAGREMIGGVVAGDNQAVLDCLQVVSHLSSSLVSKLPVKRGDTFPTEALAWLDVDEGQYCYRIYQIEEKGARPAGGTEHLYEVTSQVVRIDLSPPLKEHFQAAAAKQNTAILCVHDLLGTSPRQPIARVAGGGVYRISARRVADSLPPILLSLGHASWPISLATTSHYLVAQGRMHYGACRAEAISAVSIAACAALDWPLPAERRDGTLIGSFVTPRPEAVAALLNYLSDQADRNSDFSSVHGICRLLNSHAAWISSLWAFTLALRPWLVYLLPSTQLRGGRGVKFDEKGLHAHSSEAVPLLGIAVQALRGWDTLVARALEALKQLGDTQSLELHKKILVWVDNPNSPSPVFEIDGAMDTQPVGHRTWHSEVPSYVQLVINFGRHFWPMQLADQGLPQQALNLLMRHQQEELHPGSSHQTHIRSQISQQLKSGMEAVIARLPTLHIPKGLQRQ